MNLNFPVSIKGVAWAGPDILLVRNHRGELELPGGRIDVGEKPQSTLKREFFEESGLLITVGKFLHSGIFEVIPRKYVFVETFECVITGERECAVVSEEHSEFIFLNPVEALLREDLPEFYKISISISVNGHLLDDRTLSVPL